MNNKRWNLIYRNAGQLVTKDELQHIGEYPQLSILDFLGDLFRGYSNVRGSGVVRGFDVTPTTNPREFTVGRGLGFGYDGTLGQIGPTVLESGLSATLDLTNEADDRLDLICLHPEWTYGESAVRSYRDPTGALSNVLMNGSLVAGATIVQVKGTAAAIPAVTDGAPYDIPIAVIKVPAGAPAVIPAANIFDVRRYLSPRTGGASEYLLSCTTDAAGVVTNLAEVVTDSTIQISTPFAYYPPPPGTPEYLADIAFPKSFGTHPTEYFNTTRAVCSFSCWDAFGLNWLFSDVPRVGNGPTTTLHPSSIYNNVRVLFEHYSDSASPGTLPLAPDLVKNGVISGKVSLMRTD